MNKCRVVSGFLGSCPIGPKNSIPARHEYIYSRLQPIFPTHNIFRSSSIRFLGKTELKRRQWAMDFHILLALFELFSFWSSCRYFSRRFSLSRTWRVPGVQNQCQDVFQAPKTPQNQNFLPTFFHGRAITVRKFFQRYLWCPFGKHMTCCVF